MVVWWLLGTWGSGSGKLLFKGYKISVTQDENVPVVNNTVVYT